MYQREILRFAAGMLLFLTASVMTQCKSPGARRLDSDLASTSSVPNSSRLGAKKKPLITDNANGLRRMFLSFRLLKSDGNQLRVLGQGEGDNDLRPLEVGERLLFPLRQSKGKELTQQFVLTTQAATRNAGVDVRPQGVVLAPSVLGKVIKTEEEGGSIFEVRSQTGYSKKLEKTITRFFIRFSGGQSLGDRPRFMRRIPLGERVYSLQEQASRIALKEAFQIRDLASVAEGSKTGRQGWESVFYENASSVGMGIDQLVQLDQNLSFPSHSRMLIELADPLRKDVEQRPPQIFEVSIVEQADEFLLYDRLSSQGGMSEVFLARRYSRGAKDDVQKIRRNVSLGQQDYLFKYISYRADNKNKVRRGFFRSEAEALKCLDGGRIFKGIPVRDDKTGRLDLQKASRERFPELIHANIARDGSKFEAKDSYIAMQYLQGKTLTEAFQSYRDQVKSYKDFLVLQLRVVSVGIQLTKMVDFLTSRTEKQESDASANEVTCSRNYVHRDIKPDNVILNSSPGLSFTYNRFSYDLGAGSLYLIDFGTVKGIDASDEKLIRATTVGTPGYFAPELYLFGQVHPKSDVYSLSATLLNILAGITLQLPDRSNPANLTREWLDWETNNSRSVAMAEYEKGIKDRFSDDPIVSENPDISILDPQLDEALKFGLEADPNSRSSTEELLERLNAAKAELKTKLFLFNEDDEDSK